MFRAKLKMIKHFNKYKENDIVEITSKTELLQLYPDNAELIYIYKQWPESHGPKIVFHVNYIYDVGGIETFVRYISKRFKNKNITIWTDGGNPYQLAYISEYANISIDKGEDITCDVFFMDNYTNNNIFQRVTAQRKYQIIHADLVESFKRNLTPYVKPEDLTGIISVSKTAHDALLKGFGADSEIIYNILDDEWEEEKVLKILSLTRISPVKGIYRIFKVAQALKDAGYSFLWFVTGDKKLTQDNVRYKDFLTALPEVVIIPQNYLNKALIESMDYVAQLSDTEAFCYSVYEALERKVPVLVTDFPEANYVVEDGVNGYIIKRDLSNLDVNKIFNEVPVVRDFKEKEDGSSWTKIFEEEMANVDSI